MYVVYDSNYNIIAYHEDEDACYKYITLVEKYNEGIQLECSKLKNKSKYKLKDKEDLYLVCYGETYIQSGYLLYIEIVSDQVQYDNKHAINVLKRILEISALKDKEYKIIEKAIKIVEDIEYESSCYTPSLQYLKQLKAEYDPYIYNYNIS